jgi:ribonuclease Z
MKCYLQIVGDPASPGILVFLDSKSVLINVGEGTQRLFTESRVRLRKIQAVCFTQVAEETIGGLPGLVLTLADMEEAAVRLAIHGPAELGALLHATRHFMHQLRAHSPCTVQHSARDSILKSAHSLLFFLQFLCCILQ